MSKIGYNEDKKHLITKIRQVVDTYFYPSYRSDFIDFKIEFHVISPTYFKIINKAVNVGSPGAQHEYKYLMTEIFKYLIPSIHHGIKSDVKIFNDKNKFIKVYFGDEKKIRNIFSSLKYKYIKRSHKYIHIYHEKMSNENFVKYLSSLLKLADTRNDTVINKPNEFFDY